MVQNQQHVNEICKMCFGSGYLIYCIIPPNPCPRCKTKGIIKIKKHSNLIHRMTKIFYWLRFIGIIAFIVLLLALFYVKMFVK